MHFSMCHRNRHQPCWQIYRNHWYLAQYISYCLPQNDYTSHECISACAAEPSSLCCRTKHLGWQILNRTVFRRECRSLDENSTIEQPLECNKMKTSKKGNGFPPIKCHSGIRHTKQMVFQKHILDFTSRIQVQCNKIQLRSSTQYTAFPILSSKETMQIREI